MLHITSRYLFTIEFCLGRTTKFRLMNTKFFFCDCCELLICVFREVNNDNLGFSKVCAGVCGRAVKCDVEMFCES